MPNERHRDPGVRVYGLGASEACPWLVVCPRCAAGAFVRGARRERRRDPVSGWNNRAVTSRLPRWRQAADNRDELARGFARLRRRRIEER